MALFDCADDMEDTAGIVEQSEASLADFVLSQQQYEKEADAQLAKAESLEALKAFERSDPEDAEIDNNYPMPDEEDDDDVNEGTGDDEEFVIDEQNDAQNETSTGPSSPPNDNHPRSNHRSDSPSRGKTPKTPPNRRRKAANASSVPSTPNSSDPSRPPPPSSSILSPEAMSLLIAADPSITADLVSEVTLDAGKFSNDTRLQNQYPPSCAVFFDLFTSSKLTISDFISKRECNFAKEGERRRIVGMSAHNLVNATLLGEDCWVLHLHSHWITKIYEKNLFTPQARSLIKQGLESGAKLRASVAKFMSLLGQILSIFCSICLDITPEGVSGSPKPWAILQDFRRRMLLSNNDDEGASAAAAAAAAQKEASSFSKLRGTDAVPSKAVIPSLEGNLSLQEKERLSKLVYTSEAALEAICSPLFVRLFCACVDRNCKSPRTKINLLKNFRQIVFWGHLRLRANLPPPSDQNGFNAASCLALDSSLAAIRAIIGGKLQSHSAAAALCSASKATHDELVKSKLRLDINELPIFFERLFTRLQKLIVTICDLWKQQEDWRRLTAMPKSPAPRELVVRRNGKIYDPKEDFWNHIGSKLITPLHRFQCLFMLALLVLSGGQRLQILPTLSLRNLRYDPELQTFNFFPSIVEKKARDSACVLPTQLTPYLRAWIGRNPPVEFDLGCESSSSSSSSSSARDATNSESIPKLSNDIESKLDCLPPGGLREIWFLVGLTNVSRKPSPNQLIDGKDPKIFIRDHASSLSSALEASRGLFQHVGCLFLSRSGTDLSSTQASAYGNQIRAFEVLQTLDWRSCMETHHLHSCRHPGRTWS